MVEDDGLLEIDGEVKQPLDDEEGPLDGADEGGREGEVVDTGFPLICQVVNSGR